MKFAQGERVKHLGKPEWGLGQVLDDSSGDTVRVFFVGVGEKTLKFQYINLAKVEGVEAAHPVLDNLKTAKKDKGIKYRSLPLLIESFLREFPDGFYGAKFHEYERDYKVDAHELMLRNLDAGNFSSLLAANEYPEICRRALQVVQKTNLIFPNEIMSLKDGLNADSGKKMFSESLYSLLYGEGELEHRFEKFSDCLLEMNAAKWTTQTYFLFITYPDKHIFLKPTVTQEAAEVCGFELNYRSELNWLTYAKLLEFSQYLFNSLAALKPRDMIDVQSFIWCAARISAGAY